MHKPVKVSPISKRELMAVRAQLKALSKTFVASGEGEFVSYVQSAIQNEASLDRHVRAFELYAPYIVPGSTVLDWGCRQAPDACMLAALNKDYKIHGADFMMDDFSVFHSFAKLAYKQLEHEYKLPYPDGHFDAVISGGVLEHTALEAESLREIWRVLKEDGIFAITFLPNRWSLTENLGRMLGSTAGHNRLYDLAVTRNVLLRSGFVIESCGYHQVFPTFAKGIKGNAVVDLLASFFAKMNRPLERIFPINCLSANLYFVLRRVSAM